LERIVNSEILSLVEDHYSRSSSPLHIIYEAPTGYGKTSLAPLIALEISESEVSTGYIHVLPMRSMVRKIYEELVERIGGKSICYQASGLFLPGKNPFLSCSANISTFDSFMLNLSRVGVGKASSHYEVARSMIFTSTVVYDEAHLYGGDPGSPEEGLYTSFLVSVEAMALARSPVVVLTATLPRSLAETIYDILLRRGGGRVGSKVLWLRYGIDVKAENIDRKIAYVDKDYDKLVGSVKWDTIVAREGLDGVCRRIVEDFQTGMKVLVVANKPARATRIYECLISSGLKPLLLHGRMKYGEREELERKIGESEILVATQVVEAGVNVSYDVLYTDVAPISNLIQRAGRINRWFKEERGKVVLIDDREAYNKIYPEEIVTATLDAVKRQLKMGKLNWRSPYTTYRLIEEVYGEKRISTSTHDTIFLKYAVRAFFADAKHVSSKLFKRCLSLKGFVRSSILIPLVHMSMDHGHDVYKIYWNTIPASFSWVLDKRKQLFHEKTVALVLKQDRSGGIVIEEEPVDTASTDELKKQVCRYMCYQWKKGVFLGLLVKDEAYRDWRGLLV